MNSSWNPFAYKPSELWKSIVAFVAPGLITLGGALLEDSPGGSSITGSEYLQAVIVAVVTSAGVFSATNKSVNPPPNPERGAVGVLAVVGLLLVFVAILGLLGVVNLGLAICVVLAIIGLLLLVVDWRGGWRR